MGLYVHQLGEVSAGVERAYYIYLLDYGWKEPISEAVKSNLLIMADKASRSNAILIYGPSGMHFADEVLSWHSVNGEDAEEIHPAVLVTTRHPSLFREYSSGNRSWKSSDAMVLIPLQKLCNSPQDVFNLLERLFRDIKEGKGLSEFEVTRRMQRGIGGAFIDAVILQPNFNGIGFDLRTFLHGVAESKRSKKRS